jgi:hypothetical protein
MPVSYADVYDQGNEDIEHNPRVSYKQSLLGGEENLNPGDNNTDMEAEVDEDDGEFAGLSVVEKKIGHYDCPEFRLSEREEARIQRPWRQGLIVKLMGRRIGYKALETRLQQIWVRKGVISIIDLGGDYFLVYFTNEEDYTKALEDGPWLIYDHYLIAREWTPNFHPNNATIEKAAVWVRISGLPIEYYDAKILNYIGNRIGKTVKVDRNTLFQERGKYARVCVEVDLNKPLLAMFELKEEVYKVEYEGLHMLCRACGRFGHFVEGCPEKNKSGVSNNGNEANSHLAVGEGTNLTGTENHDETVNGPWVVVQKPRRPRRNKEGISRDGVAVGHAQNAGTGTRFDILDSINEDPEITGTNNEERSNLNSSTRIPPQSTHAKNKGKGGKHVGDKKGKAADNMVNYESTNGKVSKRNTGGTPNVENMQLTRETNNEQLGRKGAHQQHDVSMKNPSTKSHHGMIPQAPQLKGVTQNVNLTHVEPNHMTRPPDQNHSGHDKHKNVNDPMEHVADQPANEEEMEIMHETQTPAQQEEGAKSMILA